MTDSAQAVGHNRWRIDVAAMLIALLLSAIAFVVICPIVLIAIESFQQAAIGQPSLWSFGNWETVFSERQFQDAMANTVLLTAASQAISFLIAAPVAYLLARTDLPGKSILEFGFWIAVFLPVPTVMLGWIMLLDGQRGVINQMIVNHTWLSTAPFDIFTWWGIVFMHVVTITTAIKIVFFVPAFRNMDASLEEASRALGSSPLATLFKIVLPIVSPTILVIVVLGTIRSIQSFEIELILGAPRQIDVYTTLIYRQVFQEPPGYGKASVLSVFALLLLLPLIGLQQWITHRRSHATVTGKFSARTLQIGRWRWPLFTIVLGLCGIMTVVPFIMVTMATFMKLFGFFSIPSPWTLSHWKRVLTDSQFYSSLINTLLLGLGAGTISVVAFPVIAHLIVRMRHSGRQVLDFLSWLPSAIPGIVIGLGFLWLFLEVPGFKSLYGTRFALVIVCVLGAMTVGVQIMKSNFIQFGNELTEASQAHGANWWQTFRHISLPLSAPALIGVVTWSFGTAAREVSLVALLSTRSIEPLSIYQLLSIADGRLEQAAVVGMVIMLLSVALMTAARLFGASFSSAHPLRN